MQRITILLTMIVSFNCLSQEFRYNDLNNNMLTVDMKERRLYFKFGHIRSGFLDCDSAAYKICVTTPTLTFVLPSELSDKWMYGRYSFTVMQKHRSYRFAGKDLGKSYWIRATRFFEEENQYITYEMLYSEEYGLVHFNKAVNNQIIDVMFLADEKGIGSN